MNVLSFTPVSREMLHEKVYAQIKQQLVSGGFYPGQKLVLRTLAQALGTSPMPVRDALHRLESIGVIVMLANRTMTVPELTAEQLADIRDVRVALEGLAIQKACAAATEADLGALQDIFERLRAAAESGDASKFLEANWLFHFGIARASHSDLIADMVEPLWLKMGPSIRLSKPDTSRMIDAVPCHRMALDGLRARDKAAAHKAIVADITGCFDMLTP